MHRKPGETGIHPSSASSPGLWPAVPLDPGLWPRCGKLNVMKPKPPWLAPSCGFTLELQSWVEAAGGDRQRMGIRVARPAGPRSRSCPQGVSRPSRLPGSLGSSWQLTALCDPGRPGCLTVGRDRERTVEVVGECVEGKGGDQTAPSTFLAITTGYRICRAQCNKNAGFLVHND